MVGLAPVRTMQLARTCLTATKVGEMELDAALASFMACGARLEWLMRVDHAWLP